MVWNKIEIKAGDKRGLLTIIREAPGRLRSNGTVRRMVRCQCDCGNEIVVALDYWRKKNTNPACGCRRGYNGNGRTKHGYARKNATHPLYRVWAGMIGRCETPSAGGYEHYGGRDDPITVCSEWRNDPELFIEWALANGWKKGLQIERIDNDGNYEPSNCEFVTPGRNARNKRTNRRIMFNGESRLLVEWAEHLGVSYDVLNQRINILKWPIERALTTPVRKKRNRKMS